MHPESNINLDNIKKIHFIGIGGIGMSALAQMLVKIYKINVSGSDRALDSSGQQGIFQTLSNSKIQLFPQNGSFIQQGNPDLIVFSSAVEKDNPDFLAAKNIQFVHRAQLLASAINSLKDKKSIAICGSSGKTTVTAWMAETLFNLKQDPIMIGGGISHAFASKLNVGNFRYGKGNHVIFEADESDKSLLKYSPDYAVITNLGTDHYPKDELKALFIKFLKKVKKAVTINNETYNFLGAEAFEHLKVYRFSTTEQIKTNEKTPSIPSCSGYTPSPVVCSAELHCQSKTTTVKLPMPGLHSTWNFLAIFTACYKMLQLNENNVINAASKFNGVVRRYNFKGKTSKGCSIYDDYAHNVEKIISCLKTSQELSPNGKVLLLFQPHGFGPLDFMWQPLLNNLEQYLRNDDIFAFLPVYYAGGTTSFKPTSEEIYLKYTKKGNKTYLYFRTRNDAITYIRSKLDQNDISVICGARDNSLSLFAEKIT